MSEVRATARGAGLKAYEVVLRHIENAILDGTLQIGSHLPAERDLAAELGVSRAAAREAIRALEAQGVLSSSVGAGPEGGTRVTGEQSRALTRLLRLHVALADFPVGDIVELRVALERVSVALATARADSATVRRMRVVLEAMNAPGITMEAFNELDTEFHVQIAGAAANRLITDMTVAIRESLRLPILRASRRLGDWPAFRADLHRQHSGIYQAIADRDGERAADLVEAHIRLAYAILPLNPATADSRTASNGCP